VVGIAKAYTTRVGSGPMPTELDDQDGQTLQREGQEFGTVTGRARRCGWFDAEIVRFTCQLNGVTDLALTKLDVLDSLPLLKICTGYQIPLPPSACCTTGKETLPGWRTASQNTSRWRLVELIRRQPLSASSLRRPRLTCVGSKSWWRRRCAGSRWGQAARRPSLYSPN
jgi:adenylosuccinate synthase